MPSKNLSIANIPNTRKSERSPSVSSPTSKGKGRVFNRKQILEIVTSLTGYQLNLIRQEVLQQHQNYSTYTYSQLLLIKIYSTLRSLCDTKEAILLLNYCNTKSKNKRFDLDLEDVAFIEIETTKDRDVKLKSLIKFIDSDRRHIGSYLTGDSVWKLESPCLRKYCINLLLLRKKLDGTIS